MSLRIICPITNEQIKDPVITPGGHTYEKDAITNWVTNHETSPITRNVVRLADLKPNFALISAMENKDEDVDMDVYKNMPDSHDLNVKAYEEGDNIAVVFTPPDNVQGVPCAVVLCIDISGSMGEAVKAKKADGSIECDGLSRLDITKHAAETIIRSMRSVDRLGLVIFSDNAEIIMDVSEMNATNKNSAIALLKSFSPRNMTNLFDGIRKSMQTLQSVPDHFHKTVMVLTDGVANVDPPCGYVEAVKRLVTASPSMKDIVIDTFGFGYEMDSKLLSSISHITNGSFAFIPDGTMVGTIFINAISNILTTLFRNVCLSYNDNLSGFSTHHGVVKIGSIRAGQPVSILLKKDGKVGMFSYDNFVKVVNAHIDRCEPMTQHVHNRVVCKAKAINMIKNLRYGSHIDISYTDEEVNDPYVLDLMKDINNQINEAISRGDWYTRWGKHYLLSFLDAHLHCVRNNYKDLSVQHYGGISFTDLQKKCENIFLNIDPPKPSVRGYQLHTVSRSSMRSNYYSSFDPCMTPESLITMGDRSVKMLKYLEKGDVVKTEEGCDVVKCIVRTTNCKTTLIKVNDNFRITAWHPIYWGDPMRPTDWYYPCQLPFDTEMYEGDLISIVLENHSCVDFSGIPTVCLGQKVSNPKTTHEYFGTDRVINDLRKMKGWQEGVVLLKSPCVVKDEVTGLTIGLKQT